MKHKTIIRLQGSDAITITQKRLECGLGETNEATCEIGIEERQPEVGKHIVLLHELLHLIDAQMVRAGIVRRRAAHAWIANAAPNLLHLLVAAGLYRGITERQISEFWADEAREARKAK